MANNTNPIAAASRSTTTGRLAAAIFLCVRTGGVIAAVAVSAASATATPPAKHEIKRTAIVHASYEDTWSALIDVFAERGWAIQNMAKDSGLITTDWMTTDAGFGDCGSTIATTMGIFVKFNVRVKQEPPVEVAVNATFREQRKIGGQYGYVPCSSKGSVEQLIHSEVEKRTRGKIAKITAAAKSAPRGYFCASSPAAGLCAREKTDCEAARDAAMGAGAVLSACALVEAAHCFDADGRERCFPTSELCTTRAGEACRERK